MGKQNKPSLEETTIEYLKTRDEQDVVGNKVEEAGLRLKKSFSENNQTKSSVDLTGSSYSGVRYHIKTTRKVLQHEAVELFQKKKIPIKEKVTISVQYGITNVPAKLRKEMDKYFVLKSELEVTPDDVDIAYDRGGLSPEEVNSIVDTKTTEVISVLRK